MLASLSPLDLSMRTSCDEKVEGKQETSWERPLTTYENAETEHSDGNRGSVSDNNRTPTDPKGPGLQLQGNTLTLCPLTSPYQTQWYWTSLRSELNHASASTGRNACRD